MKKRNSIKTYIVRLFLGSLFLLSLSCQTVMGVLENADTPAVRATADAASSLPVPTAPSASGSLAEAVPTVEYHPYEAETYTLSPRAQQRLFDALWDTVDNEYLYADFNGLDWDAVQVEYSTYIANGLSDQEFYFRMWEVVYRLGDDHSTFMDPEMVAQEDALYEGNFEYVGMGVITYYLEAEGLMTVEVVFPDSPAERAGLAPHDNLLEIDGKTMASLYDEELGSIPSLHDVAGRDEAELLVQTPGQAPRKVKITFEPVNVQYPVPAQTFTTPAGQRIGYIVLTTFSDLTQPEEFARQLEIFGPLDGLIIDNRINTGGYSTVFENILQYLMAGEAGSYASRSEARRMTIEPLGIHNSQTVPLVVLVGEGTVSYAEVFAGVLKDQERAYLIGNTTFGNIETLWGFELPQNTFMWLAHETFFPANNPKEDWEQTGIIPHLVVDAPWHLYTPQTDPAILAALDYFDSGE